VVDHKAPLCGGGADHPDNMQWQEYQQSLVKDVLERRVCRLMSEVDRLKAALNASQTALEVCRRPNP
jgi:hypothetical protein